MVRLLLLLTIFFATLPLAAQDEERLPDYRVYVLEAPRLEDGEFVATFGVLNIGGSAATEATAILTVATTGEQLGIEAIPPLEANEALEVSFTFPPPISFTAGSNQSIQLTVGIDEVELRGSATISNNQARASLTVPGDLPTPAPTEEAGETASGGAAATTPGFTIPVVNFRVDLTNPGHLLVVIGVAGIVLLLLWVVVMIFRLIFIKPPAMGTWQPPYAALTVLDPDSTQGRRQLWQQHAQNDALLAPCAEGSYSIRKLLLGTDGAMLSGWTMTSMRLSQYDMYGRVARTHTLASNGIVGKLNRFAHRRDPMDEERALKTMRPLARRLIAQFEKRMSKKNAMLPVALDARFRGTHGEARILFELFSCRRGQWSLIDQWEPEMIVIRGTIQENFTFSIFGQQPTEDYKGYRRRLEDEMTRTLAEMVTRQIAVPDELPAAPEVPSAERYMPQDTAPHPPMA